MHFWWIRCSYNDDTSPVLIDNKDFTNYPTVLSTNVRSVFPKLDCLCTTLNEEEVDIGFISEMQMSTSNPLHMQQLDRKLNLEGYEFVAIARLDRKGGGVAIVDNLNQGYSIKRLHVN